MLSFKHHLLQEVNYPTCIQYARCCLENVEGSVGLSADFSPMPKCLSVYLKTKFQNTGVISPYLKALPTRSKFYCKLANSSFTAIVDVAFSMKSPLFKNINWIMKVKKASFINAPQANQRFFSLILGHSNQLHSHSNFAAQLRNPVAVKETKRFGDLILPFFFNYYLNIRVFLSRNYRLITVPLKFDVLKQIFAREAKLPGQILASFFFKNIKYPTGNYQTDSSET